MDCGLLDFAYEAYPPRRGSMVGRAFAEEPPIPKGSDLQTLQLAILGQRA